jgi:FHA domain
MWHPNSSEAIENKALSFLKQHPSLSDSLLANCNHDVEEATLLLAPILNAPKRCEIAPYYIQAIITGKTTFLVTNLSASESVQVINGAATWLLGRSNNCAIALPDSRISRQHAVIGHNGGREFYMADVGSSNGTWVNRRRLAALERRPLGDGELIQLGPFLLEFFIANRHNLSPDRFDIEKTQAF